MCRRIGLVIRAKGAPSPKVQARALESIVDEIWNDSADRHTLRNWVLTGRAVREGDVVIVSTPHALGETTRKQKAAEKKLAGMGVTVEHAETGVGPERKRGRPKVHSFTAEQEGMLRDMWKKPSRFPRPFIREKAEEYAGKPVSDSTLKRMFGSRGE